MFENLLNRKARFKSSGPRVINAIPVYKGTGCINGGKHRGVRLLERDMKVYKKTLEKML